jgi:recombination protein RecA
MATKSAAAAAPVKRTALTLALESLKKNKLVDEACIVPTGAVVDQIPHISTGSLVLDQLIGGQLTETGLHLCPGFPRGLISEVYGAEGCGKTTAALQTAIRCQRAGGTVAYLDYENAIQLPYARALGLDVADSGTFVLFSPKHWEEGAEIILACIEAKVDLIVVDSVSAMVPQKALEASISGEAQIGLLARKMSGFLPKITSNLRTSGTALIYINQIRSRIKSGPMDYGPDEDTSGGKALKFYASLRIELKRGAKEFLEVINPTTGVKEKTNVSNVIRATAVKNKISANQGHQAQLVVRFGEGFDNVRSVLDIAEVRNIIRKGGSWYRTNLLDGKEKGWQGKEPMRAFFVENPDEFRHILDQVGSMMTGVSKIDLKDIVSQEAEVVPVGEEGEDYISSGGGDDMGLDDFPFEVDDD